jgi:hypothetical protein
MADVKVAVRTVPKKRLVVRFGRGRLGGTTYLDALAARATKDGRELILVDADVRNPSLSKLYPAARTPTNGSPEAFGNLMMQVLGDLAEHPGQCTALVDIGGGQDRAMADFIRDLDLSGFCREEVVQAVGVYVLGPDPDDLSHAISVRNARLLEGSGTILVLSEAIVKRNQTPESAFAPLYEAPAFGAWVKAGAVPVPVQNLACLGLLRDLELSLTAARQGRAGKDGKTLNRVEQFMVKDWFRRFEEEHEKAGALELLP